MSNTGQFHGYYSDDMSPVGIATDQTTRRATLDYWLNHDWANLDIGMIERVDQADPNQPGVEWHGWNVWVWKPHP